MIACPATFPCPSRRHDYTCADHSRGVHCEPALLIGGVVLLLAWFLPIPLHEGVGPQCSYIWCAFAAAKTLELLDATALPSTNSSSSTSDLRPYSASQQSARPLSGGIPPFPSLRFAAVDCGDCAPKLPRAWSQCVVGHGGLVTFQTACMRPSLLPGCSSPRHRATQPDCLVAQWPAVSVTVPLQCHRSALLNVAAYRLTKQHEEFTAHRSMD